MRLTSAILLAVLVTGPMAAAQESLRSSPDRDNALPHYKQGWDALRAESWAEAVHEFRLAIELDRTFTLAYYGLGRSQMGLKRFGDAIAAYEACRQRYQAAASQKFQNAQEADRLRQTDLDQIRIAINALSASSQGQQASQATQNQIRQLRDQAQRIQLKRDAINNNLSIASEAPAFVRVALGSAYFRSERMADAEREYKAALEQDAKAGEAWNNLAVVYLMTERYDEAEQSLKAAEKAGYKVNPNLKDEINRKKRGGG